MVSRDPLGDSGSPATVGEARTGLVPWEAVVSAARADSALEPQ